MLSRKTKGLFVEVNGFSYLVAGVTGLSAPFTIESITEFPRNDPGKLKNFLDQSSGGGRARFYHAHCGIVPESRFFRLHSLDSMNKARAPDYFSKVLEQQFRIEPKHCKMVTVNAQSGLPFAADKPLGSQKDLIICGAQSKELAAFQNNLVECGVYPQSMQLGTLSSLAGLKHYLKVKEIEDPVMLLEVTQNSANLFILSNNKVDLCRPVNFGFNAVLPIIKKELGLKDEESAKDLFFSNTFDFREIGPKLLAKILKELNASTGFYEVQTGQTIPYMYMTSLPENQKWIPDVIAQEMDIKLLHIDWDGWAEKLNISFGDACSSADLGPSAFGLFSLFGNFDN